MKKILFTVAALLAATTTFAQTTLWDGDNVSPGLWGDGNPEIVNNEDNGGINQSKTCLKFTMKADNTDKTIKLPVAALMNGSKRISIMIRKEAGSNVLVELWNDTEKLNEKVVTWCNGGNSWEKIVFDFTENHAVTSIEGIAITATTDAVTTDQDVYIDNIVIEEAPKVNGVSLSEFDGSSLEGKLELTGAWMSGECQNANGEWVKNAYDDFNKLRETLVNAKDTAVTSIDLRHAVVQNAYNAFNGDGLNPNTLVYLPTGSTGASNTIVDGKALNMITLNETYPFNCPEGFSAESGVEFIRVFHAGNNSVILPFEVTKDELGADNLATYKETKDNVAVFTPAENVAANTPYITVYGEGKANVTFGNKTFVATPENLGSGFVGTYSEIDGAGLYCINGNGDAFAKGAEDSYVTPFHAYLEPADTSVAAYSIDLGGGTTGIASVENGADDAKTDIYSISGVKVRSGVSSSSALQNLSKGIYIVNGKKVIVK